MRRSVGVGVAMIVGAVAAVVVPGVVAAHDPIIIADSQTTPDAGPSLPDGTISFALYGVVEGPGATRGFRVRFADGERVVLSLLVPDLPPEQSMAVDDLPVLRLDAPDGTSRELLPAIGDAFDEAFSGTRYIHLLDLDEPSLAGEYAITVIGRAPARFTVSVGTIERFGTPVDGVVDRAAGVGGVQVWYDTPPPAAPATTLETTTVPATPDQGTSVPATPVPATPVSATGVVLATVATRASTTAPTPAVSAPAPARAAATSAAENGSGPGAGVIAVGVGVVAVALAGLAIVGARRRRSH